MGEESSADALERLLRKILVPNDAHGLSYIDLEMGIIDVRIDDLTDDEIDYCRQVQASAQESAAHRPGLGAAAGE